MLRKTFLIGFLLLLLACQNNADTAPRQKAGEEYVQSEEETSSGLTAAGKKEKLSMLLDESKRTLDSIDVAYSSIRKESRQRQLTLDEREHVNEALMELNDAKDLIVLEVEKSIINELKEKTVALQNVMDGMNAKSDKLTRIAQTLSRVSGIIEKTTNLLAEALSAGIVRPKIVSDESLQ
jgi:uncharacterized protein (DUF885 family)